MDAYNVKLVDDNGKLLVDDPKVKAGTDQRASRLHEHPHPRMHAAVVDELEGPGQQRAFHNKTILLTHNATISIAAKWLDDANNAALTAGAARDREEELRRATSRPPASRTSPTARRWFTARR